VARAYIVSFHSNDDRPSKFIVLALATDKKAAINMAWDDRIHVLR